jgi:FtsP/CotA-like multicopper oxidase with cupredoxin domain
MSKQGVRFHVAAPYRRTVRPRLGVWESTLVVSAPHLVATFVALAAISFQTLPASTAFAQQPPAAERSECPERENRDFVSPPVLDREDGILRGTIVLMHEFQRLHGAVTPPGGTATVNCVQQRVRGFRGIKANGVEELILPRTEDDEPTPGPTLRARVGDLVQLTFINQVDAARFAGTYGKDECEQARNREGDIVYPGPFNDVPPNCLHASNTANLHFHGTHTNPNSTGDNVYLQIRPLPRDPTGDFATPSKFTTTPEQAVEGLGEFFLRCTEELKRNPLKSWPNTWEDLPRIWTDKQNALLADQEHRQRNQGQWSEDLALRREGIWPIHYVGAFPYCFALPAYTAPDWPPVVGSTSPTMGQAPGTHWYHAHKHGSTAINVMEGMSGAFIIEGKYDDDLDAAYGSYVLDKGPQDKGPWKASKQKVLVLNQLGTATGIAAAPFASRPNALSGGRFPIPPATAQLEQGVDFSVNGRLRPKLKIQPGEIQLWRIVNSSARNAAYFMAPEGFEWAQIAQDGVQFTFENYANSRNKPFYMAPANRVDLLVKAPPATPPKPYEVRIQNVLSRSSVKPTPTNPMQDDPKPGVALLTIDVGGPQPMLNNQPAEMKFPGKGAGEPKFPEQPKFLADINDGELKQSSDIKRTLVFDSKDPGNSPQHTINGLQFDDHNGHAHLGLTLGTAEEWTVKNLTFKRPPQLAFNIDHPLHIHINPFQVTEFFDPNEKLLDSNGRLVGILKAGKSEAVPFYVTNKTELTGSDNPFAKQQCYIDPTDETTWSVDGARMLNEQDETVTAPCKRQRPLESGSVWWDVFAIPSARFESGWAKPIPGYYKMRSRFVDYPGLYVMHCHILIHEDRGMMFRIEVLKPTAIQVPHH